MRYNRLPAAPPDTPMTDQAASAQEITPQVPAYVALAPGHPAPWFHQRSTSNPHYAFDTAAGRYIVLCIFGSAADRLGRAALDAVEARRTRFDDVHACF